LGVDAVGAPDAQRVAVLERARDERVAKRRRALDEDRARLDELDRERRVEDVGGREAVVQPAAFVADRRRDDVDERRHVVARRALALGALVDRERRPLPARPRRLLGDRALGGPRVERRKLDLEPRVHAARRRPDGSYCLPRVSGDHALIMRAASTPAFLAPSIATHATGTPGGICTADSSASSPPRCFPEIGTPTTGRSVWAAAKPGSAADIPAPAMITFSPRMRAFVQYSPVCTGSRWALSTR